MLLLAAFGWLVPGGAYLLMRRYLQFAVFAFVVWGDVRGRASRCRADVRGRSPRNWPAWTAFTALVFKAGALAKLLAGAPYLLAGFAGVRFVS